MLKLKRKQRNEQYHVGKNLIVALLEQFLELEKKRSGILCTTNYYIFCFLLLPLLFMLILRFLFFLFFLSYFLLLGVLNRDLWK